MCLLTLSRRRRPPCSGMTRKPSLPSTAGGAVSRLVVFEREGHDGPVAVNVNQSAPRILIGGSSGPMSALRLSAARRAIQSAAHLQVEARMDRRPGGGSASAEIHLNQSPAESLEVRWVVRFDQKREDPDAAVPEERFAASHRLNVEIKIVEAPRDPGEIPHRAFAAAAGGLVHPKSLLVQGPSPERPTQPTPFRICGSVSKSG